MSKYGAIKTEVDDIVFDSKKEANRYCELKIMERAGEIKSLTIQPSFPLIVNGSKVGKYIADFKYVDCRSGKIVIEDVKGVKTPVYRLKKRLVNALYGYEIIEV